MSPIQFVSVFALILLQCHGLHANQTFTVTTAEDRAFVIVRPKDGKNASSFENGEVDGYLADLMREIKKITGFNFTITHSYDQKYGEEQANGKWNGLIGDVVDKEADIAMSALYVTPKRQEVVAFTQPFMESGVTFMIAKPKIQDRLLPGPFDALRVVTVEIWVLIFFCLFILVVSLMMIGRYYPYRKETFGLKDSIWFLISSLMWQGYGKSPSAHGARFVAVFWWLFCAIFLMSYGAGLVHVFSLKLQTLPKLPAIVPEDLLRQTALRYSPIQDSNMERFFKTSDIPILQEFWKAMRGFGSDGFPKTFEEGVKKVQGGKFALFGDAQALAYEASKDPDCNLLVGNQFLEERNIALAVTKDKPELVKALSNAIITLKEKGFTKQLYDKWFTNSACPRHFIQQHAEDRLEMQFQPINFLNFGGVFIVLVIGIAVGLIISGIEIFLLRRRCQKEREERVTYGVEPQD